MLEWMSVSVKEKLSDIARTFHDFNPSNGKDNF